MTQKYNIAVAGATGAVGTEIVQILEQVYLLMLQLKM